MASPDKADFLIEPKRDGVCNRVTYFLWVRPCLPNSKTLRTGLQIPSGCGTPCVPSRHTMGRTAYPTWIPCFHG